VNSQIIERVKKMLRLAANAAATEGERDNALRMAHATIARYNLDLATIDAQADAPRPDEPRGEQTDAFGAAPWARRIACDVAELFFCRYLFTRMRGTSRVKHSFIGRTSNATTASLIARFVIESVDREAQERIQGTGRAAQTRENRRSFSWGAAMAIHERVKALEAGRDAAMPVNGNGTALVLGSLYQKEAAANELFVRRHYPHLRTSTSRIAGFSSAYADGHAYGKTVSLAAQVGASTTRIRVPWKGA